MVTGEEYSFGESDEVNRVEGVGDVACLGMS